MVEAIEGSAIRKVRLGKSDLLVSNIALGTLPFASYRDNKNNFSELVSYAYSLGINLFDTAEIYDNYKLLGESLRGLDDIFVITKSYAVDEKDVDRSLLKAKRLMSRDVDIFMLHEQESILTMKGHLKALEYMYKLKEKGDIKAVGISTHRVSGVRGALTFLELIDIVMAIVNYAGLGIYDGDRDEMESALLDCYNANLGIIGMKIFGGGHLTRAIDRAIGYARSLSFVHTFLLGVETVEELKLDISLFSGLQVEEGLLESSKRKTRRIEIEPWCTGCGICVDRCGQGALILVNGKVEVAFDRCVLCSYCAQVCPDFSIRVV
ncbi:MAG: aldo/keto reductase [bacterium]|nr:aldo/keto reductase [bacterium]